MWKKRCQAFYQHETKSLIIHNTVQTSETVTKMEAHLTKTPCCTHDLFTTLLILTIQIKNKLMRSYSKSDLITYEENDQSHVRIPRTLT